MVVRIILFFFLAGSATLVSGQDTTTANAGSIEITGERRANPKVKANPHPDDVITRERTRNPIRGNQEKRNYQQGIISSEREKNED